MRKIRRVTVAALRTHRLPRTESITDKDSRGRVLIVAGSATSPGAARLAGEAALRAGAGKVIVATGRSLAPHLGLIAAEFGIIAVPESSDGEPALKESAVKQGLEQCDAALIGPGLMNERNARQVAVHFLKNSKTPVVLDAAAITGFADHLDDLRRCRAPRILTPHAGEMATLMGTSKETIEATPAKHASAAAKALGCTVVLKGADTYIAAPNAQVWGHRGGERGLATAGSGDTLSGLIVALLSRGAPSLTACLWAVLVHARAGARLSRVIGPLGFLAGELPAQFPRLLQDLDTH
jgi:ADP-dependent NAD(P)H-hydrate dehydratase